MSKVVKKTITLILSLTLLCCLVIVLGAKSPAKANAPTLIIEGASVKIMYEENDSGLRFNVLMDKEEFQRIYDASTGEWIDGVTVGSLVVPDDMIEDGEMVINSTNIAVKDYKLPASLWRSKIVGKTEYMATYVYIYGFPAQSYNRDIAIVVYVDDAGQPMYSSKYVNNMSNVAYQSLQNGDYVEGEEEYDLINKYIQGEYTVNFDLDGGTAYAPQAIYKYGQTITLPSIEPFKDGYDFGGWYNGQIEWSDSDIVKGNMTLTANWIEKAQATYTVNHYQEGFDGTYSLKERQTLTGTVGEKTNALKMIYSGFTVVEFEQKQITADNATVVDIYYQKDLAVVWGSAENVVTTPTETQVDEAGIFANEFVVYNKKSGSANNLDAYSIFISNEGFKYSSVSFDFYFESMNAGMQNGKPYMSIKCFKEMSTVGNNISEGSGETLGIVLTNKATGEVVEYVAPGGGDTWANVETKTWYTITVNNASQYQRIQNVLWYSCEAVMYIANVTGTTGDSQNVQSIIARSQEKMGYYAWPSVAEIGDGKLMAVCSERDRHTDPYGRVVGFISEDRGASWSEPFIIMDGVLDDRDAGIVYWNGKVIVSTFTQTVELYSNSGIAEWVNYVKQISQEEYDKAFGSKYCISIDNGQTWGEVLDCPIFAPHGMIITPDGKLAYVGYAKFGKESGSWLNDDSYIGISFSEDGINWSEVKMIASAEDRISYGFDEPHAVYNDNGEIVVALRTASGIYQTKSADGGNNWSEYQKINDAGDTPPHLLKLEDDTIILTYGYRSSPHGIRAMVSYDGCETWSEEIIVTSDGTIGSGEDWDMGYPCTIYLGDGKLLTVYYQRVQKSDKNVSLLQVVWDVPEKEEQQQPDESQELDMCAATEGYLRKATTDEIIASSYDGDGTVWCYSKPTGVQASANSNTTTNPAQVWIDVSQVERVTFRIYVKSWSSSGDPHLQISKYQSGNGSFGGNFESFSIVEESTAEQVACEAWGAYLKVGKWYSVTVDVSGQDRVHIVQWASASGEFIFADII